MIGVNTKFDKKWGDVCDASENMCYSRLRMLPSKYSVALMAVTGLYFFLWFGRRRRILRMYDDMCEGEEMLYVQKRLNNYFNYCSGDGGLHIFNVW